APARHALEVPRVARRKIARVLGRASHRELVAVRDAEHHRAGFEEPPHRCRGVGRLESFENLRARRRLDAPYAQHILHSDGNAGERWSVALSNPAVGFVRLPLPKLWREAE